MNKLAVLVSGWGSPNGIEWKVSPILTELRANGYDIIITRPKLSGTVDIRRSGKLLARMLRERAGEYDKICLIGHSMGGLVARYADMLFTNWGMDIDAVCTLGSPHKGTWLANAALFSASARQMAVGSPFLNALADSDTSARYFCIGAKRDELVFPRSSALLDDAEKNLMVRKSHMGLIFNTPIAKDVVRFFNES